MKNGDAAELKIAEAFDLAMAATRDVMPAGREDYVYVGNTISAMIQAVVAVDCDRQYGADLVLGGVSLGVAMSLVNCEIDNGCEFYEHAHRVFHTTEAGGLGEIRERRAMARDGGTA